MNIQLIRNSDNGRCVPLNDELVINITDAEYKLDMHMGKKYELLNIDKKSRFEIMPAIKKYDIIKIIDVSCNKRFVYFTACERISDGYVRINLMRYHIEDGNNSSVYNFEIKFDDLEAFTRIAVYILDDNYLFFQYEYIEKYRDTQNKDIRSLYTDSMGGMDDVIKSTSEKRTYNNFLFSIEDNKEIAISDERISRYGIERLLSVDGNVCFVKIGHTIINEALYENISEIDAPEEIIALINVKQFISDIMLQKKEVYMNVIDVSDKVRTFPYMKLKDDKLLYSRVEFMDRKEEIVVYDYEKKASKVRLNNSVFRVVDLLKTYIINDTLYYMEVKDDITKLINLNNQKTEYVFGSDAKVKSIKNDFIIVEKVVPKSFLHKEATYICVYKLPDIDNSLFREKGKFTGLISTGPDSMTILSC